LSSELLSFELCLLSRGMTESERERENLLEGLN